jgi:hypothetical protein
MRSCSYAAANASPKLNESMETLSKRSSSASSPSGSSPCGLLSSLASESEISSRTSPGPFATPSEPELQTFNFPTSLSDSELFRHFLEHTSKSSPSWHKDRTVLQVGIAKLALESEPVSHSLLALSAACLCCDMISQGNADPEIVNRALNIGLQHHISSISQMQIMTSQPENSNAEALLANAALLVPFAVAFQHINHWILCNDGSQENNLSVTPRDAVTLMRGINSTALLLNSKKSTKSEAHGSETSSPWITMFSQPDSSCFSTASRSHSMFPIIATTCPQALSQLRSRVEIALLDSQRDERVVSTHIAFEILNDIVCQSFSTSTTAIESSKYVIKYSPAPESLLAEVPAWLRCYTTRSPKPLQTEPLARTFLAFFCCAPEAYLDVLFPLLDQRDGDRDEDGEEASLLSGTEVLALDVYAHWLVLMFLIEEEAWWSGNFPILALQGLIKSYGYVFGQGLQEQWWPSSMLEIMTQMKQWK